MLRPASASIGKEIDSAFVQCEDVSQHNWHLFAGLLQDFALNIPSSLFATLVPDRYKPWREEG